MGFLYSQLFVTPPYPTQTFTGQTIIVTGSNVGLGLEAARHFTRLNASKVILAVRNTKAGEAAKSAIEKSTKRTGVVEVWELDLGSYASVKAFATKAQSLERVDVLLENAGIAVATFRLAEQDESTITVNVVSTFLLGFLMLPKLQESATKFSTKTYLSIVSSEVHGWTHFKQRENPEIFKALSEKDADISDRYPLSKLLEVLVIRQIAPEMAKSYPDVILNTLNPGLCHSSLSREGGWVLWLLKLLTARTTEVGARTLVAAAATGAEGHGKYMTNSVISDEAVSDFARSEEGKQTGEKVWKELKGKLEGICTGVTKGL
jgi:NAD(P)-dependent dehydrogenase (short-subunit alcohol dehydrogenase family)